MEFLELLQTFSIFMEVFVLILLFKLLLSCWILPIRVHRKLKNNGFNGPTPKFPLGNLGEMKKKNNNHRNPSSISSSPSFTNISHDIHSSVLPHFARWQKPYGKVFVYWLGTEPFLYIADPEFLKEMSKGVMGKSWGKPNVFKKDREPMFGKGLVMLEGDDWIRHRHVIAPALSPLNLRAMSSSMVESTNKMLERWAMQINSGNPEIDMEKEIIMTTGEIIATTIFGVSGQNGSLVLEKLRALHIALFKSNRYVGVPLSRILNAKENLEARKLGKEIDSLLLSIITNRRRKSIDDKNFNQRDLLGLFLKEDDKKRDVKMMSRELVDECKTLFFAGYETTALALMWTLMLLSVHSDWQEQLRDEIRQVIGDKEIDLTMLAGLKKMNWVMNEVLRLYPPAPNAQRQARQDIQVGELVVPKGTNIWIDVVAMHHDAALWGGDVNEFRPERFEEDHFHGGCSHKMGFLPFGFGGRMCVGRNLTLMEYKIVLSLILSRFRVSVSPGYRHEPSYMLSLKPALGLPLIVQPLNY